jgi:hypothetical protein
MRRVLACSLALFLATSLRAFEVSRPEIVGRAPYYRFAHEMATNGESYLVVWEDQRPGISVGTTAWAVTTVRGAVLDAGGHPAGPHDFAIAPSSGLVAVTSNGEEYLVVTAEYRDRGWTGELRLNVVTKEGRVRATTTVRGQFGSITAAGEDYYAVIHRDGAPTISIFDSNARELASGIDIDERTAVYARLFGTSDGRLFVSWKGVDFATRVAFVSPTELAEGRFVTVSDPEPLWEQVPPQAMLETPAGYLLVWSYSGLTTALLDRDGAVVENAREAYDAPSADFARRDAVVLPTSTGFVAVDSRGDREGPGGRTIYGVATRQLDERATATGEFELIDDDAWHVAGAPAPGGGGIISYFPVGTHQVRIRRVTPSGEIELAPEEVVATRSVPSQHDALIRRCGSTWIVAWTERTGDARQRVLYRRFDSDLRPIDPPNALAGSSTAINAAMSLACGTSSALLIWPDDRDLRGVLLPDVTGAPRTVSLGSAPVSWLRYPVVFDGTGYVIVRGPAVERWSETGDLLLSSPLAATGFLEVALGWNGSELLVAGEVRTSEYSMIAGRRLSAGFQRIGPDFMLRSSTGTYWSDLEVASADDQWLVGWIQQEMVTYGMEPRSLRVHRSGALLDPDGGVVSGPKSRTLSLTWNGSAFEILTEHAVTRRYPDGMMKTFRILDEKAWLLAIEEGGETPLLAYWRSDPAQEVRRLFAERVARSWSLPYRERRRNLRP